MQRRGLLLLVLSSAGACSADDSAISSNEDASSSHAGAGVGGAGGAVSTGGSDSPATDGGLGTLTGNAGARGNSGGATGSGGSQGRGGMAGNGGSAMMMDPPSDVCPPPAAAGAAPIATPGTNIALNKVYAAGSVGYPNPAKAFDGNDSTDTDSGKWSVVGYLTADLGAPVSLYRTVVKFGGKPTNYRIQGSNSGCQWTDILRVTCPNATDARTLPAATYRYVRFSIDTWSVPQDFYIIDKVKEIEVYARGATDPPGAAPNVYPAPLDRTGWVASAYANSMGARDAIDATGVPPCSELACYQRSNWDNGHAQEAGQWFQIDMGKQNTFNYIDINNTYDHPSDVPVAYDVLVSDNGTDWGAKIASGKGAGDTAISFAKQQKRYVRIVLTANTPAFWRIADFNIFNTDALPLPTPAECP